MKISGTSVNNVINIYEKNKREIIKNKEITKNDYIEISSLGKSLSSYGEDVNKISSAEKIEKIRMEISRGTYSIDANLIAKSMINVMKARSV
ncbi:anti-sigma-28 factor, FlgM [Clostridium homopropionicum DSM 5847]|uniref:Anti-sigma-28 factor, FlgM n=1 Tax=Clostridium homopropionicum DSM 5847 TaxID=1121318 RepID=A0A0L6ZE11_9CLOT|nr:flagellar biosynthesis anti-sigma factor FlgM [Clostridium homopropionicum]KOA21053.1 anti-sigma-28 factor, FlgM [Clostridium homopropionicum DSM 5847]SFF98431.1 anti-sigma-28 factor, FlgM family [Clostridium homopropionicum]